MKRLPINNNLKEKAKQLRKAGNLSEVLLWQQIKNKKLNGYSFDRQKVIGNYIVDFYCTFLKTIIEIDGETHNEKIEYDIKRDNYFHSLGLNTIHLLDVDIKTNLEGVIDFLKARLQ